MNPQLQAEDIIHKGISRLNSTRDLSKIICRGKRQREKFVITNLLDWFVSQISPSAIAEYQRLRERGRV
jgi:hypothetical protein